MFSVTLYRRRGAVECSENARLAASHWCVNKLCRYCFCAASHGSPENRTQPFMDPSSRRAPANDAQLPFTQTGTKPRLPVPNPGPIHPIRLPPSDSDGASSIETKAPKPRQEVSAAGSDKPLDDFKLPVEEERSSREITGTGTLPQRVSLGGRNGTMEAEAAPGTIWGHP